MLAVQAAAQQCISQQQSARVIGSLEYSRMLRKCKLCQPCVLLFEIVLRRSAR